MYKIILAIETSINYCSIAIYKNNSTYSISKKSKKTHTKIIFPILKKILSTTKTKLKELNCIVFSKGPGNFTSIRIGASIAKSLSISLKIPIFGVSTLAIMAEQAWRKCKKTNIVVLLNINKNHIYWAKYIKNKKSIWVGEKTEAFLEKKIIKNKIKKLKKNWMFVTNNVEQELYLDFFQLNEVNFFFPHAKDMIPFVLFKIKHKKSQKDATENIINYLHDL